MSATIACGSALFLVPGAIWLGRMMDVVDHPGDLKIHAAPISVLGGAAVLASVALGLSVSGHWPEALVMSALVVALLVGLADDMRPLPLSPKLAGQSAIAMILVFSQLDRGPFVALCLFAATIAVINGVNLLDGQDGLAGGLGLCAAFGLAAAQSGEASALGWSLGGALLGFLPWNWSPARIFLGDSGAYVVGAGLVAVATPGLDGNGISFGLGVGVCLGVFAFEFCFTVVRRLRARAVLVTGDRLHSYDLLSEKLGSRPRATVVFWVAGAACAGVSLLIVDASSRDAVLVSAAALVAGIGVGRWLWTLLPDGRDSPSEPLAVEVVAPDHQVGPLIQNGKRVDTPVPSAVRSR